MSATRQAETDTAPNHILNPLIDKILAEHRQELPDLSRIVVILPGQGACQQFRHQLLQRLPAQQQAVIPPWCGDLNTWCEQVVPLHDTSTSLISSQARNLLLLEALELSPDLFKRDNSWQVSRSLLQLFDQLTLNRITIADSFAEWLDLVQQAYTSTTDIEQLNVEARLIHTLWQAWQQQLAENEQLDSVHAYVLRLAQLADSIPKNSFCYIAVQDYNPAEQASINNLIEQGLATYFEIDSSSSSATTRFIRACYDSSIPLLERSQSYKARLDRDSERHRISVFTTAKDETQARAIDLQIRQWLHAGTQNIGVICEDRKLSRRLRALLERSNITLQDSAGWSLATTSAASVIERWLECIEEDFDQRPLLDLLKSTYVDFDDNETYLENVYRFERDIIKHENINRDISRYRHSLDQRRQKLQQVFRWLPQNYDAIKTLLDRLELTAQPLDALYRNSGTNKASVLFSAFIDSLDALGIIEKLEADAAGVQVLNCLEEMRLGLRYADPGMRWRDFRTWLSASLEDKLFSSHFSHASVKLMTLNQSSCQSFDAVIIAAADRHNYPGSPASSPFFNQSVRRCLQLPDWNLDKQNKLKKFQYTLLCADRVLITCKDFNDGEPQPLSPWVESLIHFHELVYGDSIVNDRLHVQLRQYAEASQQRLGDEVEPASRSQITVLAEEVPHRLSASSHQRLINCPYQFFAADCLGLKTADEISTELQKADYGERIHFILQAFHTPIKNLPKPFTDKLTDTNRERAIQHLSELSEIIFRNDITDNVLHSSWYTRWRKHIPAYIDWQIARDEEWDFSASEIKSEVQLDETTSLYGRLDRIDKQTGRTAIIDYKTGSTPRQDDVDSGEDVQLASYSLLQDGVTEVAYLSLDETGDRVKSRARLEDEQLKLVRSHVSVRLTEMLQQLRDSHPMTAWGDDGVCRYCNFNGICRRNFWSDTE